MNDRVLLSHHQQHTLLAFSDLWNISFMTQRHVTPALTPQNPSGKDADPLNKSCCILFKNTYLKYKGEVCVSWPNHAHTLTVYCMNHNRKHLNVLGNVMSPGSRIFQQVCISCLIFEARRRIWKELYFHSSQHFSNYQNVNAFCWQNV